MSHYRELDFPVINDEFETALDELRSIVTASRLENVRQI
jgi:guanylate kinase